MRIVLGALRLSTSPERDEARARTTLEAAVRAGFRTVDTARAYGHGEEDLGHNERLVGTALGDAAVEVVTKCGMRRDAGAWIPDARAKRIREDAEASASALGRAPDLLLLHAPDPKVPLTTSARALAKVKAEGLARAVGVSNVSRRQLLELAAHAPVEAAQIALGAYDDLAVRSGVVAHCLDAGIRVLAHAPLGGPERAKRLARDPVLVKVGERVGGTPIETFLAYVLALHPRIEPVVGARSPDTVASLARAHDLVLDEEALAKLDARFPVLATVRTRSQRQRSALREDASEVMLLMGIPGAGKSSAANELVAQGWERLNRDTLGGSLRGIAKRLDERLAAGTKRVVLDNTYVTRAVRSDVVRIAEAHRARVRCVHFDTSLADAQVNAVRRMLERFGRVLSPEEIAAHSRGAAYDPAAIGPHVLFRMTRELEPPEADEGFTSVDAVPFVRRPRSGQAAVAVAYATVRSEVLVDVLRSAPRDAPVLLYAWLRDATDVERAASELAASSGRDVTPAVCTHPAGPPICWCRPPLPGLWLAFEHARGIDPAASVLVGTSPADKTMASQLGLAFRGIGP